MAGNSDLDVAYVARLARITLTEDEAKTFQKQLDDVLKYVEKLRQLDVTGIEAVDGDIEAYLSLDIEAAMKEAEHANVDLPLGGVPIAIKDVINVMDQPCTCASRILNGYRAPYDATVIQKLRAAGAIPFGKTNLDEFAMGSSTENS